MTFGLLTDEKRWTGAPLFLLTCAKLFGVSFGCLLTALVVLHFGLLTARNRSTIEFCERKPDDGLYDRGVPANFLDACGRNPLLWLLPFPGPDLKSAPFLALTESVSSLLDERESLLAIVNVNVD